MVLHGSSMCVLLLDYEVYTISLTSDVVEVVETVEVQAAGLSVCGGRTQPPDTGRPEDVRRPNSIIGSGTGLEHTERQAINTYRLGIFSMNSTFCH